MSYKRISPIGVVEGGTGASTLGSTQILLGNTTSALTSTSNATIDTGTGAITLNTGTGALNIGTDATAKTITVGSTTTSTGLALKEGTGNLVVSSATGTLITQKSTGEMTRPLQPAFLYSLATTTAAVTGNGAVYTLGTSTLTKIFDQASNCTTGGVFTAPVTGIYLLVAQLRLGSLTALMTLGELNIVTTSKTYYRTSNPGATKSNANDITIRIAVLASMSATDTATVTIKVSNGASNAATVVGSATKLTYFSGQLIC